MRRFGNRDSGSLPIRVILLAVLAAGLTIAHASRLHARVDLGRKYRARLESEKWRRGHDWTAGAEDVWSLRGFVFAYDSLKITLGPSEVVFGKKKEGTSVLWAAVMPQEPGKIETGPAGQGERVTSIFLRFHPSLVRGLFPPSIVQENGSPQALIPARRLYQYKIEDSQWEVDGMPRVPGRENIVLDCETAEGKRRVYLVDTNKRTVEEDSSLIGESLPSLEYGPLQGANAAVVLERVWKAFDLEYPAFQLKPELDWEALREEFSELALGIESRYELAGLLAILLGRLEDLDVDVEIEDEPVWCHERYRFRNANSSGTESVVGELNPPGGVLRWQRTRDGFGYIFMINVLHKDLPELFDSALGELRRARGLVLDLRYNFGDGNQDLARAIAGRFTGEELVYGYERERSGPEHDDLGEKKELKLEPRGPWTWEKPVTILCGERTMGAAESLALMLAATPKARIIGDRTAGAITRTRTLELPGEITVELPRALVLDLRGRPIHGAGLQPDIALQPSIVKFRSTDDPVLRAALEFLKKVAR